VGVDLIAGLVIAWCHALRVAMKTSQRQEKNYDGGTHASRIRHGVSKMTKRPALLFALLLSAAAAVLSAAAQERRDAPVAASRHALIMGNADYPDDDAPLRHPIKDARALADELRRSGFQVDLAENLTKQAMSIAIANFKMKIKSGSAALIFFSGHGIQVGRQNYLIPINAQIWAEADVRRDGIAIESLLADIDGRGATVKLVIIDASRVNPFERRFRGFSAGLAPINASQGTLIVYAAAPEKIASDATSENSLFVSELLKEIRSSGKTAEQVFISAARGVSRASEGKQVPWISSSLAEDFYFRAAAVAAKPETTETPEPQRLASVDKDTEPRRACVTSERPSTKSDWSDFLAKNPKGPCADLARDRLAKLDTGPSTKPPLGYRPVDDRAIRDLDEAVKRNPNDAEAYFNRGQTYAKRGDYQRAIRDFNQAVRINPNHPEALNDRCWIRAIVGQLRAALGDCSKALALQPNFADAFDSLAFTYLKMGQARRAIPLYDAALRGNPEQASSLFGRGKAKLRNGEAAGGQADIEAARAIKPNIAEEFAAYGVR
jgi:tetratricopeptide (TPR) repeat protein